MTEEESFLRSIADGQEDWLSRLVYADWLDERGDPRAEYLRVQYQIATSPGATGQSRRWERLRQLRRTLGLRWVTRVDADLAIPLALGEAGRRCAHSLLDYVVYRRLAGYSPEKTIWTVTEWKKEVGFTPQTNRARWYVPTLADETRGVVVLHRLGELRCCFNEYRHPLRHSGIPSRHYHSFEHSYRYLHRKGIQQKALCGGNAWTLLFDQRSGR